jgi:GNAT superfamily N-acetyltransferase
MSTAAAIRIDDNVSDADEQAVHAGLRAFNVERLGPSNELPVRLVARAPDGSVVGGVIGHTKWRWMYVAKLWVADSARGAGVGTRLMQAAEDLARSRGCTNVSLDTFEYQARPFYEKLGYELFGTLEGYPPGYRQYYLTKEL